MGIYAYLFSADGFKKVRQGHHKKQIIKCKSWQVSI